jgi:hypothetical protein
VICWQIAGKRRLGSLLPYVRPGMAPGLGCWFVVEPPAGIEPATPSLPWIGGSPPCYPPFLQVVGLRSRCSYVLSFGLMLPSGDGTHRDQLRDHLEADAGVE